MHPLHPAALVRGARLLQTFVTGRLHHANVQLTNRCNMRCGFCTFPERAVAPKDELTVADWRRIARQLSREGSLVTSLEGGEPTLRADLPQIVDAFAHQHHPWLYTNGWFVTDALARDLFRAGVLEIGVSIDYADPKRHDASRRLDGAFERAVTAIQRLAAAAPRGPRQVHILSILLDDNVDALEPLLELSAKLGVRHMITLLSTFGFYRSDRAQRLPSKPVAARLTELKTRHPHLRTFRSYVRGIDKFLAGNPPPCGAGLHGMNIDHLGNVSPCIELASTFAGNLARDEWPAVKRRLAALEEPRSCKKCWTLCRGSTEAMAGTPRAEDWSDFFREFVA
jgi:radical SAM protein with 4Fe4S-binding SPASM domain